MPRKKKSLIYVLVVLIVIIAALVLLYQGGRWLEHQTEKPEVRGDYTQRYAYDNLIEQDGVTYRQRKNLTTILLMGIDTDDQSAPAQGYRNGGQADFLRLVVVDHADKSVAQIRIDRDTMTPITVLGVLGNKSGVRTAQICLSHGFGDGKNQSCELTVEAISNLLLGMPIDFYVAMNMEGIPALNDMLGGVKVTIADDFSSLDPSMTPGTTMTLKGDQAELFVRSRRDIGVGTNEARMARQEVYVAALADALFKRAGKDKEFIGTLYDSLTPYLTTNLPRGRMINEVWSARNYEKGTVVKPEGTHTVGSDGFMQFYADESALKQTVLELFFERVK